MAANGCERAKVGVVELRRLAPVNARENVVRHSSTHLLGSLGHSRHRCAVLIDAHEISGDEHLRMRRQAEIRLHTHTSRAVEFGTEKFAER